MISRVVRFYDLRILRDDEMQGREAEPGFWRVLGEHVNGWPPEKREDTIRGRRIFGEHRVSRQPARPYFYIGRVRDRAEWPDVLVGSTVGHLELQQQETVLLEPSYVVPFGDRNRVAVLSMSRAAPSVAVQEEWITIKAGMDQQLQATLIPILKPDVEDRVNRAQGAVSLTVVIPPLKSIPEGGGQIGRAAREGRNVSTETTFTLKWSLGHRRGAPSTTSGLLDGARWVDGSWASSADVSLDVPDEEGVLHREQYNLIKHRFTLRAWFDVPDDQPASEESVMSGMTDAIEQFSSQMR
jgi:hypothetical protein